MNDLCSKKICNITIEKYKLEYKKHKEIFDEIHNICIKIGEPIEGNCFTEHLNIHNKIENLIYKQANHFSLGMISNEIMEIGFNAGHSSLIYLISNPNCNITIFDLCEHKYTLPCFTYLQKKFPNRLKLYQGDSTKTVPQFTKDNPDKTFDLIHIDGCHVANIANQDFYNSYKIAKKFIIWDDTQILWINKLFEDYVSKRLINELFLHETKTYEHRICQINKIPKIIMQTSKNKVDKHIINTIDKWCPKWEYYHFIDTEIIDFFKKNQLKEFPNIIEKFNSFQKGQHKADLFRYYFLYIKGGVFLDSDAEFETYIDKIIKNYIFVSVKTFMDENYIFNGFIATQAKNPIIYEALKHAYNADNAILNKLGNGPHGLQHYHYFCEELWRIYHKLNLPNCKIYQEVDKSHEGYGGSIIIDDEKNKMISHYWKSKKIPIIETYYDFSKKFTEIYKNNFWIKGSGAGSYIENTIEYNKFIINFIKEKNITTITDIGCGDWQSSNLIYDKLDNIDYLGLDCVNSIINENKIKYNTYKFQTLDVINNLHKIRHSDLYIIKDVLQHWEIKYIYKLLDFLVTWRLFKYIVITNNGNQNVDLLELNCYFGIGRGLHSKYLPLKKYNAKPLLDYFGGEGDKGEFKKHMCMIEYNKNILKYIPENRNILEIKKNKNVSTVIYPENIKKEKKLYLFETQKDEKLIDKKFIDIGFIYFDIQEINSKLFSDIKEMVRRNRPTIFLKNYQLYKSAFKFNIPKYCVTGLGNYIYKKNINSVDLLLIPVHHLMQ